MKWLNIFFITLTLTITTVQSAELKRWKSGDTPRLKLQDTQGKTHDLVTYKGKVVIVNFWATWCVPCRQEMPSMQRLRDKLADKPFEILAVDLAESEETVNTFLKKIGVKFPALIDKDGKAAKEWKVIGFPSSFIIDSKGKVYYSLVGELNWDDEKVVKQISELLPITKKSEK